MRRPSLFICTVIVCVVVFAIESCSANIAPTVTPTIAPTLTPTNTPTETPIPLTSTPKPPSELSKEDFKSNIDELTDLELKAEWDRLRAVFPEAEIYITDRGEICIFNSKDVLMCGQVIRGSSGSTFTFLISPTFPWEIRINLRQIGKDNVEALNTIQIPDMVNNPKKGEIIRIMETLLDLKGRIITANEDLAKYESVQPPRHLIATFGGIEEESSIVSIFTKDIFHNYEGYEIYFKNPNTLAGRNNAPFWEVFFGIDQNNEPIVKLKFSRIVKANNDEGTFVYAHLESGIKDTPDRWGETFQQTITSLILRRALGQIAREYLSQRGEMTGFTMGSPFESKKFEHIFDNYSPLSLEYWNHAFDDGMMSVEEEEARDFYITNIITFSVESFTQTP